MSTDHLFEVKRLGMVRGGKIKKVDSSPPITLQFSRLSLADLATFDDREQPFFSRYRPS